MRYGSLCSALLHGGVVALLLVNLPDAGGAPSLGAGGGALRFEVVTSIPGAAPSEESLAANSVAEEPAAASELTETPSEEPPPDASTQVATAPAPPPAEAALPPPPPPNAAPMGDNAHLPPVPVGPSPNTPAAASVAAETPESISPKTEELAERESEPILEPRPREPRLPEETVSETPPEAPLETVEVSEEALALAAQPVAARDPQLDQVPPEKPLRKVEVPAPQLVKKAPPEEPVPEPLEQTAAEPDAGEQAESLAAQPAGMQQAALPGDRSNDSLGSQGAPGPAGGATLGMSAGELQDYAGLLVAWLDKHKRYPDSSRRRKEEGVVMVEFAIDGRGRVLSHRLLDASGYALLDAEATALLARASPVPAPPDGVGRSFQVPVVFALR